MPDPMTNRVFAAALSGFVTFMLMLASTSVSLSEIGGGLLAIA